MKISKKTMEILKNFNSINQNILIRPGTTLMTRTVARNLFASAEVDTDFPQEFGIYNLQQFLGVLSLFSDPDLEFGETAVVISQGKNRVRYNYASQEVLAFPEKAINEPELEVKFVLTEENLKSLLKAGAVLSSTDLQIKGDGEKIICTVLDPKNSSVNTFSVEVGDTDLSFDVYIKLENIKVIPGEYQVGLAKRITKFAAKDYNMYVANEKNSSWS